MSATPIRPHRLAGISLAGVVVGIVAWWAITVALQPPAYLLPPPSSVAGRLAGNPDLYLRNAAITLEKILVGGSLGAVAGILLGSLIAHVELLRNALMPYLVTMRVLPKIAIAPVLLLYLGLGMETAVLFVAIISVFPVVISTAAGFERVPDRHLDLLNSVDADPISVFVRVRARYALPDVFAGLKQAVALAVIGAIVAEWILSTSGLGYLILVSAENLQTSVLLAALALLLVVGLGLYGAMAGIQRASLGSSSRYSSQA